jgi:hypothetical protein
MARNTSFQAPHYAAVFNLSTKFSNTLSIRFSLNISGQIDTHAEPLRGLIFEFLGSGREDKRLWTEW